jgi:phospholipid transport system substrate-binding protein
MVTNALATIVLLLIAAAPTQAADSSPTQELRTHVDRAIQALADPATKGEAHIAERRARIRKIADEIFDYGEMCKRALGVHYQQLDPGQRERFTQLFSDLLDRAYFEKIDSYNGEKVQYLEPKIDGDEATVQTKVVTERGTDVPVDYRMRREQGRWIVYDVIIEGVSLVSNYRSQFDRIIRTASVAELMRRMEAQAAGQAGQASPGPKPRGAGRE